MEYLGYFFRFLWRIKWWLIILPLTVALIAIYQTRNSPHVFQVESLIYTGSLANSSESTVKSNSEKQKVIDNLINIIRAKSTLRHVSMRLYAQDMIHGDSLEDNNYITAKNFRYISGITPPAVRKLIDKSSEEKTLNALYEYADKDTKNFLYGLYNWDPPYYSYSALSKIQVYQVGGSDMIKIQYGSDDPGIAYHTLVLLNDEFMKQYEDLNFGETNDIIKFFERELARVKAELNASENSLTAYNVKHRIVNYEEQTKQLAALQKEFEVQYETIKQNYQSAKAVSDDLERRIGDNIQFLKNNSLFIHELNQISDLSAQIARMQSFGLDTTTNTNRHIASYKEELGNQRRRLKVLTDTLIVQKYTTGGYLRADLIEKWLTAILNTKEAGAQLAEMDRWKAKIEDRFTVFSPVGSTLKRKEREINFTESSYLELLRSLNSARLRQKSLQMTTANLSVLTPPSFPLGSDSNNRKVVVIVAFFGTFFLILFYFLLIELFDRTLHNRVKAEWLTNIKVVGAFPDALHKRYQSFSRAIHQQVIKTIGNKLLTYIEPGKKEILNFLVINKEESRLIELLGQYYEAIGFKVKLISWKDYPDYSFATLLKNEKLSDLFDFSEADIILFEHPPLASVAGQKNLLTDSNINILLASTHKIWKGNDRIIIQDLKKHAKEDSKLNLIITDSMMSDAQYFAGLLPPKTPLRKLLYRVSQLGLRTYGKNKY